MNPSSTTSGAPAFDLSKVNVGTNGMVQTGPGSFANKDSLSENGYKAAVNYQATKDGPASVIQTTTAQRAQTQDRQGKLAEITSNNTANVGQPKPEINMSTGDIKDLNGNVIGKTTDSIKGKDGKPTAGEPENDPNDPLSGMKKQIDDIKAAGAAQISQMNTTLQGLMSVSDANTQARIESLKQMYANRIDNIHQSYKTLGMAKDMQDFRNGVNRYTPAQGQGVLTDNEVKEQLAVSDLIAKMNDAVTRAQSAQDSSDTRLFNEEFSKIESYQKDINNSISNLMKEATNYNNSTIKATAQAAKDTATKTKNSLDLSKRAAPMLSEEVAGLSEKDRKKAIEKFAKENGIDPNVLTGDVQSYSDTQMHKNRADAKGGTKKTESTSKADEAKLGGDLKDAQDAIANGADPIKVRQRFLETHPKASSNYDKYMKPPKK